VFFFAKDHFKCILSGATVIQGHPLSTVLFWLSSKSFCASSFNVLVKPIQKEREIDVLLTTLTFRPFYFGRATTKHDIFYRMVET
jgi:hypothetical protein